jgi:glycosyltransferase involved in cell wall biosynthesis
MHERRFIWINKSPWKKPGAIVYMGLLNAYSFASCGEETDFFVRDGGKENTDVDLRTTYALETLPKLHIHRISEEERSFPPRRAVYDAALRHISACCREVRHVYVLSRELGVLPALFRLRKKCRNLRVFHEAHDFFVSITHRSHNTISDYRRCLSERMHIPRLDGLICLTDHQQALYQEHFPRLPALAVPLGCLAFPGDAGPEERISRRRVIYIGHLHEAKGREAIFALAGCLAAHGIKVTAMGGSASHARELNDRAEELGLSGTLDVRPFVPPAELHGMLGRDMSIGLAPLEDTFYNRYLTCPVKVLDYISHGLPVAATDLPSIRALLGPPALYCKAGDTDSLARKITELLDNRAEYAALSRSMYEAASRLSWRNRAVEIMRFCGETTLPLPQN